MTTNTNATENTSGDAVSLLRPRRTDLDKIVTDLVNSTIDSPITMMLAGENTNFAPPTREAPDVGGDEYAAHVFAWFQGIGGEDTRS